MKLLIPILCVVVYGCNMPVVQQPNPDKDVHTIIAACILDVVGSADSAIYYYKHIPVLPLGTNKEINTKITRYNDSIYRLFDTAKAYFLINDTLGGIEIEDQLYLNKIVKHERGIDTSQLPAQLIDTSYLSTILGISARTTPDLINDELRLIGFFNFSRIVFTKTKTRAWIALNFSVRKVGYCDYFILEKKLGNWVLTKRERTWVS